MEQEQEQEAVHIIKNITEWNSLKLSGPVYDNFMNAINSQVTQYNYTFAIKKLMQFLGINRIEDLLQYPASQVKLVEAQIIIPYLVSLKKEGASFGTTNCYLAAIKTFYEINDYNLNRRKLARYLPDKKKPLDDRGYTTEEIAKMLQGADERLRALILLLACTGMRIGALADMKKPLMQLRHLEKIQLFIFPSCNRMVIHIHAWCITQALALFFLEQKLEFVLGFSDCT
jgi:integrase